MGRFDISPEVAEEYRVKFRHGVQEHVDEEVLAVGTFRTTGSGTKYAISKTQAGALAYGAAALIGKKRAGGLPGQFVLAVTPTSLYAFKYKQRRDGIAIKEEVAVWDRAGLAVSTERMQTTTRVQLEWPDAKVVCDQEGLGDNPWADEVVRLLQV
ncbi:MAG TPA: hypothetical protein VGW10_04255 [Solirubrobacteraceae bacterium]|nr:hypothetical protein [Solirubrobacteraceae bacterium]